MFHKFSCTNGLCVMKLFIAKQTISCSDHGLIKQVASSSLRCINFMWRTSLWLCLFDLYQYVAMNLKLWAFARSVAVWNFFLLTKVILLSNWTPFFWTQIRALGRNTRGGVAMRLREGDKIASMDIIPASLQKDLEVASKDSENK